MYKKSSYILNCKSTVGVPHSQIKSLYNLLILKNLQWNSIKLMREWYWLFLPRK